LADRRSIATSLVVAAWHLARLDAAWHLRWRLAARRRLVVVDGSYYDVLLRTDELGLAKQLIRPGSALAALAPRADLVVLVDDETAPRRRPEPTALEWEPWTWGQLAPWMGERVRTVSPSADTVDMAGLLDDVGGEAGTGRRWGRVPLRGRRRDLRVTPGPQAGQALALFWAHRRRSRAVLALNQVAARTGALIPVVPPIDDLGDLCSTLGLEPDAIATARSRVEGRRMLGIVSGGRLAAVVKVGPADDRGLRREADMLGRLAEADRPLSIPRLRWAGTWRERYVVAMDAVPNRGSPRRADTAQILDLCVAMATGGPWGASVVHGDLAPWNLLVTDAGLVLVDWENAELESRPMHDLTHFLVVEAGARRRATAAAVVAQLVGPGGAGRTYLTRIGLDPNLASTCARMYFQRAGDLDELGVPAGFAHAVRDAL
jgi:hypothetical protein